MISSFFLLGWRAGGAPTQKKKRGWVGWLFTQGVGLSGLALGYYHAAPSGLGKGEPDHYSGRRPTRSVFNSWSSGRRR